MSLSNMLSSLKGLLAAHPHPIPDRDEQYLAESVDIYDLERRMRQLDSGRQDLYAVGAFGVFSR